MIPTPRPQVLVMSARALHAVLPSPAPVALTLLGMPVSPLALRAYQTGRYVLLLDTVGLRASEVVTVVAQTNRDPQALPLVAVIEEGDQRAQVLLSGSLACYAIISDVQARRNPLLLLDLLYLPPPAAPPSGVINPLVIGQLAPHVRLTTQEIMVLHALYTHPTYAVAAADCYLSEQRLRNLLAAMRLDAGVKARKRFPELRDLADALIAHMAQPAPVSAAQQE